MQPTGPVDARILIVGEAPGAEEEREGRPFVGASGRLLTSLLASAGLSRDECFITNVCRVRPPGNDISAFFRQTAKPPGPDWAPVLGGWATAPVVEGLKALEREIALVRPKVIIPLGNLALLAVAGQTSITKWRGSELKGPGGSMVVPTIHPAAVLREMDWYPFVVQDLRRAAMWQHRGYVPPPAWTFITRPSFDEARGTLEGLLRDAERGPIRLACDIETRQGQIACVGLAWARNAAISLPLMDLHSPEGYWRAEEETTLLCLLARLLRHPAVQLYGQNFSYDSQYFYRWLRILPRLTLDTMVAHHVLFSHVPKDLATLASLYCERYVYWKDDGKEWRASTDEAALWRYNCEDAARTWEIAEALLPQILAAGLWEQCYFQHEMWWLALETMIRGVRRDKAAAQEIAAELRALESKTSAWLERILQHPLNVRSSAQMKALFYDDLRLPPVLHRKTGSPTLDDEALEKLCTREPIITPLVERIRLLRSISVFLSTFVEARPDRDGRYRCSYNIAGTETYRLSSSKNPFGSGLNLQNIPKGDEESALPNVRRLFLPDEGMELFDMDLDSADLRVVVWESDCREMKEMLREGKKVYVELAKEYYHDPTITKHHPKYGAFKSLCHGTNYLGSARGIAPRVGLLVREVERLQAWYFGRFPEIRRWQEELKQRVREKRIITNPFGFRRVFTGRVDEGAFREAAAWIPQSTIALLINHIWRRIRYEVPEVEILLQVHDSLVGQYPASQAAAIKARILAAAQIEIPYPGSSPLVIPVGLKVSQVSWGDCA